MPALCVTTSNQPSMKQPQTESRDANGQPCMVSAILASKQHRRKTRNIQRQTRYKQQAKAAAAETVLPVVESTAE